MSNFTNILEDSKEKYIQQKIQNKENLKNIRNNIDNSLKNQNIFSKIYDTAMLYDDTDMIRYPYFHTYINLNLEDRNFYFREKLDFKALKNRDTNTKPILCLMIQMK